MNELSIKIKIADRDYPMRVSPEEEERLRVAGKFLNERLKLFRDQFGITDKQDLLAMVALETAADRLKTVESVSQSDTTFSDKLTRLNDTLNALNLDEKADQ
jgi:cell division protein ZapA